MDRIASLRAPLAWSVLATCVVTGTAALVLATSAGCGSSCVILTNGTKNEYAVEIVVTSEGELGALQADVSTDDCNGEWETRGDHVDCEALVEAIVAANVVEPGTLKAGLISLAGIETPAAVLRCRYSSFEEPKPSDFRLRVTDAADTSSMPLGTDPVLAIGTVTLLDD